MSFHVPLQRRHVQAVRMKRQVAFEPTATYEIGDIPTPGQDEVPPGGIVPSQPPPLVFPSSETPAESTPTDQPQLPSPSESATPSEAQPSAQQSTPNPEPSAQTPSESRSSPIPTPVVSQTPSADNNEPTPVRDTTIFSTVKYPSSAVSSAPSVSASAESSGGSKTGMIVGGIGAAAIAVVGIIFAIAYFIRRFRKSKEVEENMFDPQEFRRSAVLLDDKDPYKPRPPSMIQSRASPAPTFGTKYGAPPPPAPHMREGPGHGFGMYDNGPYPSFQPGQHVTSPITATSAHLMMMNEASRMYDLPHDDQAQYLVRYPSVSEQHLATPVTVQRQPSIASNVVPTDDYVDLSRSSVSPFQAAQYAEISRQLNTEVPKGLDTPAATQFIASEKPGLQTVGESNEEEEQTKMPEPKLDSKSPFDDGLEEDLEFPTPPAIGARIDSQPPILPEIHVRNGSYDFPSSIRGSSIDSVGTGNDFPGPAVAHGQKFTLTPSPLASSTGLVPEPGTESVNEASSRVIPMASATATPAAEPKTIEVPPTAPKLTTAEESKKRPDTMYTIYDPDDAYGGI